MIIGSGNSAFASGGYYLKVVPVPDTNLAWYSVYKPNDLLGATIARILNYSTDGENIYGYPEWVPFADGSSYFAPKSGLSSYWGIEQAPYYRGALLENPDYGLGDCSGYKQFLIYNSGWLKTIHSAYGTGNPDFSGGIACRIGGFGPRKNVYTSNWGRLQPRVLSYAYGRSGTMSGDWELVYTPVDEYAPPGESAISSTIDTHIIPSGNDRNPITLSHASSNVSLTYYDLTSTSDVFPDSYREGTTNRTIWYPTDVKYYAYTAMFNLYGKGDWPECIRYTANDATGGTFTGSSIVKQASLSNLSWSAGVYVSAESADSAVSSWSSLPSSCPSLYNYTPKIDYEFVGAGSQVYKVSGTRMAMSAWGR